VKVNRFDISKLYVVFCWHCDSIKKYFCFVF